MKVIHAPATTEMYRKTNERSKLPSKNSENKSTSAEFGEFHNTQYEQKTITHQTGQVHCKTNSISKWQRIQKSNSKLREILTIEKLFMRTERIAPINVPQKQMKIKLRRCRDKNTI